MHTHSQVGNFSLVLRRSSRQLHRLLLEQTEDARRLGAPLRCLNALVAMATTTLPVECFFTNQRSLFPNPYTTQYAHSWETSLLIEAARHGLVPFSFSTCYYRRGRGHYHQSGAIVGAQRTFMAKRAKPKAVSKKQRTRRLAALRGLAALFKQSRQGRVTDKGKEQVGSQPASTYRPPAVLSAALPHPSLLHMASATGSASAGALADGTEEVRFRSGDVVTVRSTSGAMWIAQLKQPIICSMEQRESGLPVATFTPPRVSCRVPLLCAHCRALCARARARGGLVESTWPIAPTPGRGECLGTFSFQRWHALLL